MTTDNTRLIGGLNPWVATAPEPVLTITDHTAVIADVRFVWHGLRCGWCRKPIALWTDGGTIDVGLALGRPQARHLATVAHWYQTYQPAAVPNIPDDCPHPGCRRPATRMLAGHEVRTGWLDGKWRLGAGPFTVGDHMDERCPHLASPTTDRLLNEVWSILRDTHPDLAAAADAYAADLHRRRERH